MQRLFHHSLHVEYALFPKGLKWLFSAQLLRGAAQQMAGLFIPLYLYTRIHSIGFFNISFFAHVSDLQKTVFLTCAFFLVMRLVTLVTIFPLSRFIRMVGLVKSMFIGNLLNMGMYLALYMANTNAWFLVLAAVLEGFVVTLYWVPYYTQFVVHAELKHLGQDVGALAFLDKLVRIGMPMLGGIIAASLGFRMLHLASAILFLLAAVVDDAVFLLWPIFIFFIVGTVERVGYVYSLVLFVSLVIAYFMGWYLGKHKGRTLFVLCSSLLSALWVARIFVQQVWHIITIDLVDRLAVGVYEPIFDTVFFRKSRGKHVYHIQIYREVVNSLAAICIWSIIILFFILPFGWTGAFLLAGFGILLSIAMGGGAHEAG
ncbi:MAG: hypothetical protein UX35_C0010G0019 [Microgenomates group bacterium GW2011_GWA1_46_15]|nr:MAG: hypothetical protein UX35_C0010G0019 [Microgenomates group bacterium GW2011_GWA1_46_15]